MAVKDIDRTDELLEVFDKLSRYRVKIGILSKSDSERHSGGISVLGVAAINEYGATIKVTDKMRAFLHYNGIHLKQSTKEIVIPERSFIRSSYDQNKNKLFELEKELDKVINLELPVESFFEMVGEVSVDIIKKYLIEEVKSPPNSQWTIDWKDGKTNPLVNTGKLANSIDYEIVRG